MHTLRTELFEALITKFSELAERRVIRVAERENRIVQMRERRRGVGFEIIPKGLRIVRWFAVSIRAGNDEHIFLLRQVHARILRHVDELRGEAVLLRFLRSLLRQ